MSLKMILKKNAPFLLDKGIYFSYGIKDIFDTILGRRDHVTPPTRLMNDGPRSISIFRENGERYLSIFRNLCALKPNGKVLDVGCGIGRKAIPLTNYLNVDGEYEGFDIMMVGIEWCNKNISPKYPNFHFQKADVFNKYYNPDGKYKDSEYKFPFKDNYFDLVFLGSVFTHMLPGGLENYLSEVSRVLKVDGKCLISFFLLNDRSKESINSRTGKIDFKYQMEGFLTTDPDIPEDAVCYAEMYIRDLFSHMRLVIQEPILYGAWSERENSIDFQDIIIGFKK